MSLKSMLEIRNYSFSFKLTFSNPFFLHSFQNTKNVPQKWVKLYKTTVQNQIAKRFTTTSLCDIKNEIWIRDKKKELGEYSYKFSLILGFVLIYFTCLKCMRIYVVSQSSLIKKNMYVTWSWYSGFCITSDIKQHLTSSNCIVYHIIMIILTLA